MSQTPLPELGVALMPQHAPDDFVRFCERIDDLPFERLWIPDERFFRDVGVALTLAAMHTRRVQIGPAVTDPYIRHPASTATLMATIDELSGGRLTVGIGAGVSGFKAMGVEQKRPALAIRESVELMRSLWAYDGTVDFHGKTTSFEGGALDFSPLRRRIPIWIAGRGPAVLQLAGEVADGVMIGALASEVALRYARAHIERGLARAGREPATLRRSVWLHTAVDDDPGRARDAVRNIVVGALVSSFNVLDELGIPLSEELKASLQGVSYGVNNPEMRRLAATIDDDVLRHFSVAGTPTEVGLRMRELAAAGIDHVAILPWLSSGQTFDAFLSKLAQATGA
jgi:5,10-methylenetetrahydromethanopterin reductase